MASPDPSLGNAGNAILLGSRVDLYPDQPVPEFNSIGGPAYAARLKGDSRSDLIAFLCTTGLPPRLDSVNAMRTVDHPSALKFRENGVVYWPHDGMHYQAIAYERPLAPRYRNSIDETYPAINEDSLNNHFIRPMIGALAEYLRTGSVHGAIRPTNIFWRDGSVTPPQIGECLTVPSGIGQPALFEPLERALAPPIARGQGLHTDDCYAFGVTVALLVLGHNPLQGLDDKASTQVRLDKGTFNALIGTRRLAGSHIELLRGLLTDDSRQRWSATELEQWLGGRRLTPKSSDAGRRASRHFDFAGSEYWQVRPLAAALATNVPEAVKVIENGNLGKWLMRSLGDEGRAESVSEALETLKESGKTEHYEDQLVSRACMALDPPAPIRYRGLSVMPAGIANMLSEALIAGTSPQILAEIIANQFATFWVNMQKDVKTELVPLAQMLERMRNIIEKSAYGNGIERVAYELNPNLPCLSPMLRKYHVSTPRQLLPALEQLSKTSGKPTEPMDRHIAAFLIVRDKRSESLFSVMGANGTPMKRGLALLSLYSEMQYRHGPDEVPGLAAWLFPLVESSTKRFLSNPLREKVKKKLKETVESGSLGNLHNLIDDPRHLEHDEREFIMARRMHHDIVREMMDIEAQLRDRGALARTFGRPVAATLSSALAIVLILFALLRAAIQTL